MNITSSWSGLLWDSRDGKLANLEVITCSSDGHDKLLAKHWTARTFPRKLSTLPVIFSCAYVFLLLLMAI